MRRVLPADVYDTLELSALANNGIGQLDVWNRFGDPESGPCCILGHVWWASNLTSPKMRNEVTLAGINGWSDSDLAVRAINRRLGRPLSSRVTFAQWAKELGVVRGE